MSQGLKLNCFDWGNPDAPLLLLVHGGKDHARSWDRIAEAFCRDWHVVAPDLRGHGDSEHLSTGQYRLEEYTCDLWALINRMTAEPVTIIAHSLGGNVALRYAALYPERVRRLVVIEGLGRSQEKLAEVEATPVDVRLRTWIEKQRPEGERPPRLFSTFEAAVARMKEANPHLSDELARHLAQHGSRQNADGTFSWKFDSRLLNFAPVELKLDEIAFLWGRITCPLRLIHGKDSWMDDPSVDGRVDQFPNATVSSFSNAGHWVHHDQTDAFIADVQMFLADGNR